MDTKGQKLCSAKTESSSVIRNACVVLLCSLAMLLASNFRVPFYPVPFTLQNFTIIVISIFAGRKLALASLLLFCAMRGIFVPTVGYIAAFFVVPFIIGNNAAKLSNFKLLFKILLSQATILSVGAAVLSCFIGLKAAFVSGFLLFVPADILKSILAFTAVRIAKKRN